VPTYEYACTECGDRIEVVQRFTDDPLTVCSACGGKLRKLFSAVGIVFKGSGFYRTDSRSGSSSVKAGANGSTGSDSSSSGSDKSDKTPASGSANGSAGSGDPAGAKTGSASSGSGEKKAAVGA
jgi:putative FmdB family regulatory protein